MGCGLSARIQSLENRIDDLACKIETERSAGARHRGLSVGSSVDVIPAKRRRALAGFALYIACDVYRSDRLSNLRAAKKDAEALATILEARGFKTVDRLFDEKVTAQNIMMSLSRLSRLEAPS